MITEKDILESRRVIKELIEQEKIGGADQKFVSFFMQKAENALETAMILDMLFSSDKKAQFSISTNYNPATWIVNAAYYAMFYAATAFEILQIAEAQAKQQIENVRLELEKRRIFTYEMGKSAEEAKARSSIKRAKEFVTIIKEIVVK